MTAIQAEFSNHKRIPSRKVLQIILEVPEEHTKQVFDTLGYPNSSKSIWVAVARLTEEAATKEELPAFLRTEAALIDEGSEQ